jgi:hypothetical protein
MLSSSSVLAVLLGATLAGNTCNLPKELTDQHTERLIYT